MKQMISRREKLLCRSSRRLNASMEEQAHEYWLLAKAKEYRSYLQLCAAHFGFRTLRLRSVTQTVHKEQMRIGKRIPWHEEACVFRGITVFSTRHRGSEHK